MTLRTDIQYFTPDGRLTQAGFQAFNTEISATAAKLAAAAAVPNSSGGATIDSQARAELIAIKGSLA